jgi:hypothetical protein
MGTPTRRRRPRGRPVVGTTAMVVAALGILSGCGSSSKPASTAAALGTPLQQACTAVTDVLMNGPDPDVDPIGYALAQPRPLESVQTTDSKLKAAITSLADAYRSVATSDGSKAADAAVKSAAAKLNAICPGAAS